VRTIRDEDEQPRSRSLRTWSANDVQCIAESRDQKTKELKSILVRIDGEEYWVPYSVIDDDSEVYGKGHTGKLVVQFWWAKTRDLVEDDDS